MFQVQKVQPITSKMTDSGFNADVSMVESADIDTNVYTADLPNRYCGRPGRSIFIKLMQYVINA